MTSSGHQSRLPVKRKFVSHEQRWRRGVTFSLQSKRFSYWHLELGACRPKSSGCHGSAGGNEGKAGCGLRVKTKNPIFLFFYRDDDGCVCT